MFTIPTIPFLRFKRRSAKATAPLPSVRKNDLVVDVLARKIVLPPTRPHTAVSQHVALGLHEQSVLANHELKRFLTPARERSPSTATASAATSSSSVATIRSTSSSTMRYGSSIFLLSTPGLSPSSSTDSIDSTSSSSSWYSTDDIQALYGIVGISSISPALAAPTIDITPPEEGDQNMAVREAFDPAWLAPPTRGFSGAVAEFVLPHIYLYEPLENGEPSPPPETQDEEILHAPPLSKRGRMYIADELYFFHSPPRDVDGDDDAYPKVIRVADESSAVAQN
ncbi:hypothetical protein EVG20_g10280 [Dentipellis fragilis]|uniref:Uncharacterized protein n=1 Tax=Dentipellis fragilis TaxID=205917 RepID=A0A4Y9XSF5_9AGAM|nr:hypothetical protein EVG20_g10280 [Dentipellis fragilis]